MLNRLTDIRAAQVAILVGVFLALLALVWLGLWWLRARERRAVESVPLKINVKQLAKPKWQDRELMASLAAPFVARGFQSLGAFGIVQLPKVGMDILLHESDSTVAIIFEHPDAGHWVDVSSYFSDGSSMTCTTSNYPQPQRPGSRRQLGAGMSPGALYTLLLRERPKKTLLPTNVSTAPVLFEQDYEAEAKWRRSVGEIPVTFAYFTRAPAARRAAKSMPPPAAVPTPVATAPVKVASTVPTPIVTEPVKSAAPVPTPIAAPTVIVAEPPSQPSKPPLITPPPPEPERPPLITPPPPAAVIEEAPIDFSADEEPAKAEEVLTEVEPLPPEQPATPPADSWVSWTEGSPAEPEPAPPAPPPDAEVEPMGPPSIGPFSFPPPHLRHDIDPTEPIGPLHYEVASVRIEQAEDLLAIERALLGFALSVVPRAVLLRIRRGTAQGWDCAGETPPRERIRAISIPLDDRNAFRMVVNSRMPHVGPLDENAANGDFIEQMDHTTTAGAALLPVLLRKKVVYVLYVDSGDEHHNPDLSDLLKLTQACSEPLERLVHRSV